jgi:hypothetical protein
MGIDEGSRVDESGATALPLNKETKGRGSLGNHALFVHNKWNAVSL